MKEPELIDGLEASQVEASKEPVAIVTGPPSSQLASTSESSRIDRLKSIEDDIFRESAQVVRDALKFSDVDPEGMAIPDEWLTDEGLTKEQAEKRLRVAKMALMNKGEAPVGLELSAKIFAGIVRARALEKQGPRTMNVNFVQMNVAVPEFDELKVEK